MLKLSCALGLFLFSAVAIADVKPIPPSQWPRTVADAVPPILAILTPTTQSIIRGTPKENLFLFQGDLGEDIRSLTGVGQGNLQLMNAACGGPCTAPEATLRLMEALLDALNK
jgi:hypothetical protein